MISNDFHRFIQHGYVEFIYYGLSHNAIKEKILHYIEHLMPTEERNIKEAFLTGLKYSGHYDAPEKLAELYFETKHKREKS
jgi:hypothetical protein